jgi:hypothetical protein
VRGLVQLGQPAKRAEQIARETYDAFGEVGLQKLLSEALKRSGR